MCLLGADFNWWLKVIFTSLMVHHMHDCCILPEEQGAVAGRTTIYSIVLKQLFMDQANVLHVTCAESSTDAMNCYDAVNNTMGSFAMQAMDVAINLIQ
jgi:hypothetical protein